MQARFQDVIDNVRVVAEDLVGDNVTSDQIVLLLQGLSADKRNEAFTGD